MNGKPKFPNFSGDIYRPKWRKYNELIVKLEENELHRNKLERMCLEIARAGMYVLSHFGLSYMLITPWQCRRWSWL